MPGRKLSNNEAALKKFWDEPAPAFNPPLLKGISISGPPALRGVENIHVPFDYPITAICGRNGVGKSTVLALAAFSSRRPDGWSTPPWMTSPSRRHPKRMNYHWKDFFFQNFGEAPRSGLLMKFQYSIAGDDVEISRRWRDQGWVTVPDPGRSRPPVFPVRHIEFVSLSRILPPAELHHARRYFGANSASGVKRLSNASVSAMSDVFGKTYNRIEIHEGGGGSLAKCFSAVDYCGFDMGAGENAVISIFESLERLPVGGLLIIEEIEHGLHPEAQSRLMDALTKMVRNKRQQIIFTTHSSHVLDRLPQEARVLLDKVADGHLARTSPTTRFAMSNMAGSLYPEATIYVEDDVAQALVKRAVSANVRKRVNVVIAGDKATVAGQLAAHYRADHPGPAACVFDGDCTDKEINRWFAAANLEGFEPMYCKLPSSEPPEKWMVGAIREAPYLSHFAAGFGLTEDEAITELDRLGAVAEHHDICYELSERTSFSEQEALSVLISSVASIHSDLDEVRTLGEMLIAEN